MSQQSNPWFFRFTLLVVVAAAFVLGGWAITNSKKTTPSTPAKPVASTSGFMWGASIIPYPTGPANQATVDRVFSLAKDLGLKVVRFQIPIWLATDQEKLAYTDAVVDGAAKVGIAVDLIIKPDWTTGEDIYSNPNLVALARQRAETVVSHYKGKVQYYQIANEVQATSLKPTWSGATTDAYNDDTYAKSVQWLNATSAGIRATDPAAKIVVTGNWLGYGFFERAFKDGLDVDILGWDWFEEPQNIHQLTENGQSVDLIKKLEQFNKPIWFVEAGYSATTHTEAQQATLDEAFLRDVRGIPSIKGALVGVLVDQIHLVGTPGEHDGIVSLDLSNPDAPVIGTPKPAYYAIKNLISNTH